jgi:signal peptide peptidase SppA
MKTYHHLARWALEQPWAVTPAMLNTIQGILSERMRGSIPTAEEIAARIGDPEGADSPRRKGQRMAGSVAVLPVFGVLMQRVDMMTEMSGGTSVDKLAQAFRALVADPSVGTIVLDVDSPGGGVYGVAEFAAEIFAARGQKRVVAVADSMAASAAYWIATAAEELVVTPGGQVGSIGVYMLHEDWSGAYEQAGVVPTVIKYGENKAEGINAEPLSDAAKEHFQETVNAYGEMFTAAVAAQRGVSKATVLRDFGQGRMFLAEQAVALKMADSVGTLQQTLMRLTGGKSGGPSAEGESPAPLARIHEKARLELAR